MELQTPQAIRAIKESKKTSALVDGRRCCILQAMSFAMNYHRLDVEENERELIVHGTMPVKRIDRFVLGND
jgi:hypothetical protein